MQIETHGDFTDQFVGLDARVPVLNGDLRRYINLDSAASTPALKSVQEALARFLPYYSSVHRGMGFKSQLSTWAFEESRRIVLQFVEADPGVYSCLFVKNATEALNVLAHRFPFSAQRNLVLTTGMEHHSNDLPWRAVAEVLHVGLTADGRLDEQDFDHKLSRYGDRIGLVAISGASNVTGYINPIHRLAEKAHATGAQIAVDAAQLAPHRSLCIGQPQNPGHLDYLVLSAHKMYAPYGTGALIGRRETFAAGAPFLRGGGTVKVVTLDGQVWGDHRDEAGSPNTVGAVAMAAGLRTLRRIGMETVAAHEASLTAYALTRLSEIPGIRLYGDCEPEGAASRLGVIPFSVEGMSDVQVSAILGYEYAIGARNGRFCAYPYTMRLLGLTTEAEERANARILAGDASRVPGLVRVSFGLYNTREDVDALIEALTCIDRREFRGEYVQDPQTGDFIPEGWQVDYEAYFRF